MWQYECFYSEQLVKDVRHSHTQQRIGVQLTRDFCHQGRDTEIAQNI
jgi:hypothetical protein